MEWERDLKWLNHDAANTTMPSHTGGAMSRQRKFVCFSFFLFICQHEYGEIDRTKRRTKWRMRSKIKIKEKFVFVFLTLVCRLSLDGTVWMEWDQKLISLFFSTSQSEWMHNIKHYMTQLERIECINRSKTTAAGMWKFEIIIFIASYLQTPLAM